MSDLLSGERLVLNRDSGVDLYKAVAATMAVPVIFSPIACVDGESKKRLLVDGGLSHCHPTVEGHKTAVVKCMTFPGRDKIWPDSEGDVIQDIGVMPGLDVLFPPSKKEIDEQVEEARRRLTTR